MVKYQSVNFRFRVELGPKDSSDVKFQSVSGLDSTLETETIKEGGENGFEHILPLRRKYGPLILKRGLLRPEDSGVTEWLNKAFVDEIIEPRPQLNITLLNSKNEPLMYWELSNVWPRSWKIGELNAMQGEILIETLELNYNRLIFNKRPKPKK